MQGLVLGLTVDLQCVYVKYRSCEACVSDTQPWAKYSLWRNKFNYESLAPTVIKHT